MPLLIDRDVLLNELKSAVYEGPSPDVFNKAVELATGALRIHADTSEVSGVLTATTIGDDFSSISYTPADFTYTTTTAVNAKTDCMTEIRSIDDIVKEKLDEYRELMRLQALGCKNCGGSINKETMVCEYCGTNYRN
jgi:hypothetical protein